MGPKEKRGRRVAGEVADGHEAGAGGLVARRHSTPEERRAAVEAFGRSGLTQAAFARQWGVSPMTINAWLRRYAEAGPKGLERLAEGAPQQRGRAPLAEALKAEIVSAKRSHPTFGLKKLKAWLWRFVGVKVSPPRATRPSPPSFQPS